MIDYAQHPDQWEWAPYFSVSEFTCKGSGKCLMQPDFMQRLFMLRDEYGKPMIINSGYRSPEHNAAIGGEKNSAHILGRAADIRVYGSYAYTLVMLAQQHGFPRLGLDQRLSVPIEKRYVHIDSMTANEGYPSPWCWSYP